MQDPEPDADNSTHPPSALHLDVARQLSGRPYLSPADARRRYAAIIAALSHHTQHEVAVAINCTDANISQLVERACKALNVTRPSVRSRRPDTAQPGTEGTPT
jgi:hypothetical protein